MQYILHKHRGHFAYAHKNISYHFWSTLQPGIPPDTVLFLGTSQVGKIAQWVAEAMPTGTVVVEGAPHWHAHPSAHDLHDFMQNYTTRLVLLRLSRTHSMLNLCILLQSRRRRHVCYV